MNKIKFGSYIKESRMRKNYTQQELADLLFVDVTTVSKWERGVSYPDITLIPDICRVLEISEHELIESSRDEEYRKIKKDSIKYNNMKKSTFWTLNIGYIVAILTCFIVNIAVSHNLSWFFIVLTSIMCAYSFCPTITWAFTGHKNLIFVGSTFISLFFLFLTCSIYTNNYWFLIATSGVLLGYFIAFYPIIFKKYLKDRYSKSFLLTYVSGMFIITSLLLISIYFYISYNLRLAFIIEGGVFMIPIVFGVLNLFEVSKKLNKPILLSLVGVFLLLLVIGIGRAIYLNVSMDTKVQLIEGVYNDIKIDGKDLDINVYLSNNENKVVYLENKKVTVEVKVIDGILTIRQIDNRKFYDEIFNFSNYEVDLYLSKDLINSLSIKNSTGDVEINKGFIFSNVNISAATGDVNFKSNVSNDLNIEVSTGDVEVEDSTIEGNLNIKTSTGDIDINKVNCGKLDIKVSTGDTELIDTIVTNDFNMEGKTGNLEFEGFDASNIYVTLSTGDVRGTILSSKIFIVKSKTGKVDTPETLTGGVCKITLSTGNIKISYK